MIKLIRTLLLATLFTFSAIALELQRDQTLMLPMTDGVKLNTVVQLPKEGDGPWPVVLVRTTYGVSIAAGESGIGSQGIAGVYQDVRGTGVSEGEKRIFHADGWREGQKDGVDTLDWILAQPWCNGDIATTGGSALAMTQTLLAPASDKLKAQVLFVTPGTFYDHVTYHGGVMRQNLVTAWLTAIAHETTIEVYKSHPLYDDFWRYYDGLSRIEDVNAPALFVGGWFDIFLQGTLDSFTARETRAGEGARGNNYLIMQARGHTYDQTTDYKYKANRGEVNPGALRNTFLRHHLLGEADALDKVPKVQYYILGDDKDPSAPGNEWRTADTWPPYETLDVPYYLHADGALRLEAPTAADASLGYLFDPENPYPTLGGANLFILQGPFDQRRYSEKREDYLAFATEPLAEPLEVVGRIKVMLHVSSDAPDTDFTAKLLDIYPEGDAREIQILDGIRRVKTRNGFTEFAPLLEGPDQIVELEIDLLSTAWAFNTGHRIGLHISSSNSPRFEVNANTGADHPGEGVEMRKANNRIHLDAKRPSALYLPLRTAK